MRESQLLLRAVDSVELSLACREDRNSLLERECRRSSISLVVSVDRRHREPQIVEFYPPILLINIITTIDLTSIIE